VNVKRNKFTYSTRNASVLKKVYVKEGQEGVRPNIASIDEVE